MNENAPTITYSLTIRYNFTMKLLFILLYSTLISLTIIIIPIITVGIHSAGCLLPAVVAVW